MQHVGCVYRIVWQKQKKGNTETANIEKTEVDSHE